MWLHVSINFCQIINVCLEIALIIMKSTYSEEDPRSVQVQTSFSSLQNHKHLGIQIFQ